MAEDGLQTGGLNIDGLNFPSAFDSAPSVLKQPVRLGEMPYAADPFGGYDEQKQVEIGVSEHLLDADGVPNLIITSGSDAGEFRISAGYVNSEMPTLGGTALNNDPPPEHTVAADTWFWVKVVGTFGSPDTYAVTIETTANNNPPASDAISGTEFTGYFPIGWVDYTAGSPATYEINNEHSGGNLMVRSMGNSIFWGKV